MALENIEFLLLYLFLNSYTFLENYPPKSEVLLSMGRKGSEEFNCISGLAQNDQHKKYEPCKKRFFDRFLNLFDQQLLTALVFSGLSGC